MRAIEIDTRPAPSTKASGEPLQLLDFYLGDPYRSPKRFCGTLHMSQPDYKAFLMTLVMGADRVGRHFSVWLKADGHRINLSNDLVKRGWTDWEDPHPLAGIPNRHELFELDRRLDFDLNAP